MAAENDTLSKYGQSFQTKVISTLLTDVKLVDSLHDIVHKKFFDSEPNKWIIETILGYYSDYRRTPTMDVFKVEIEKIDNPAIKKSIIGQLKEVYTNVDNADMEYIKREFTNFCINQNIKQAIIQSVDLLKTGNYDRIKELVDKSLKVGMDSDIGHDYILDMADRYSDILRNIVSTDWDVINELMQGGLGEGELGVVVAPSGVGKTWVLCALGAAAVKAGKTVVHYSMELSESYVGMRYDTIFTGIPSAELKEKEEEVRSKIKKLPGKLLIRYFPPRGVSPKKLETHIEKMISIGQRPDLIIVDYADLLLSHSSKNDSTYSEQGGVYIELRGMSGELKIPIWTASQTNRSGIDSEVIEADKIADSYAKVMNADFIMSVSRKSKDKLTNTARVHIMKNRFGQDGLTFPAKMDTVHGVLDIYSTTSSEGIITSKESSRGDVLERQLLHKKYVEGLG
jgi:replicative DNA helicase